MSFELLKRRMEQSGLNVHDEMINESRLIEEQEIKNDVSYCDSFYKVINQNDYDNKENYIKIHPRLFSRRWASFKNHEMKIHTLINEPIKYGDLFYDNKSEKWWLCMQSDCIDDIYYSSKLLECNYLMYWQKDDGSIVSRYCYIFNASSYSNGETDGRIITLRANQFMAHLTFDEETDLLENNKRIHIARTNRICKAYDITRTDDLTYGFDGFNYNGVLSLIFTQDETVHESDKLVTLDNGKQVWICDYIEPDNITNNVTLSSNQSKILSILYNNDKTLKIGSPFKIFVGVIKDRNGKQLDDIGTWEVISTDEIRPYIVYEISNNELKIKIKEDVMFIGGKVRIKFYTKDRNYSDTIDLNIVNVF